MDHLEIIKLLLARARTSNARVKENTLHAHDFHHQWLYEEGATPFLRAAQSGDVVLMKLLLEHGADPKVDTDDGDTALTASAGIGWVDGVMYEWSPKENIETVSMLLDLGVDPNARQQRTDAPP